MLKKSLLVTMTLSVLAMPAYGHGVWAGMRADKMQIVYGEGPLDNTYNPDWFAGAKAFDSQLKPSSVIVNKTDGKIFLEPSENVQVIAIISENGYWSNTKSGKWINKAKDENPEATKGKQHHKYSVNYISQDIVFKGKAPVKVSQPKAVGLEMEIVPATDPRFLKAGDKLEVQVLYQGKPMSNAKIMPDSINQLGKTITTDANGKASVTVANNGVNMIAIETSYPRKDTTKADGDGYFSSLNFTIMPEED